MCKNQMKISTQSTMPYNGMLLNNKKDRHKNESQMPYAKQKKTHTYTHKNIYYRIPSAPLQNKFANL